MTTNVDVLIATVQKAFAEDDLVAQDVAVAALLNAAREIEAKGARYLELWRELPLALARIRNRGGEPSAAEAAANLFEAASYRSLVRPNMRQLSVLLPKATPDGLQGAEHENLDPRATAVRWRNSSIAAMLADESMLGTSPRSESRYLARPTWLGSDVDARGMLELADEMLDRSRDGTLDRPLLWLERAHALALLSASDPEDEALAAAARRAMRTGENAQLALSVGDDDAQYWIEQSFVAALPAFSTDPDAIRRSIDADSGAGFARQCSSATRALAAAAESGRRDVANVAVQRAIELLDEWPSPDTPAIRANAIQLARGVLPFELSERQRVIALVALARAGATNENSEPGILTEALQAAAQLRHTYPEGDPFRGMYSAVLGRIAWTTPALSTAQEAIANLRQLRYDGPDDWQIVVTLLRGLRHIAELTGNAGPLHEALEIGAGPVGGSGATEVDGRLLFERIGCAMDLITIDPAIGLAPLTELLALEPRGGNHVAGPAVLAIQHNDSQVPPTDAVEAARLLYERCRLLDPKDPAITLVAAIDAAQTRFAEAVPRALPRNFGAQELEKAARNLLPEGAARSMLTARLSKYSEASDDGDAFPKLTASTSPALVDKLSELVQAGAVWRMLTRYMDQKDSESLERLVDIVVPVDPKADRDAPDKGLLLAVLDQVADRDNTGWPGAGRAMMVIQDILADETMPLAVRLRLTHRWQQHWGGLFWRLVWQPFESLFEELEKRLQDGADTDLLVPAQGIAANAAYAAAIEGDPVRAIEIAERGQGLLAAQALRRHGVSSDLLHIDHPELYGTWSVALRRLRTAVAPVMPRIGGFTFSVPTEPPTRLVTPLELFQSLSAQSTEVRALLEAEQNARSDLEAMAGPLLPDPEVAALVAHAEQSGARLCYLISTRWSGLALILNPHGNIAAIELPGLEPAAVSRWIKQIETVPEDTGTRTAYVRGASTEPNLTSTLAVIGELSNALAPLVAALSASAHPVELIPTGQLARLPVVAALQWTRQDEEWFDVRVATSGRLHISAAARLLRTEANTAVVAITNPSPSTRPDGIDLPNLPAARSEGEQLTGLIGGIHYTGPEATILAATNALADSNRVLHFAVHGNADPNDPELSRIFLSNTEDGRAAELTAKAIARSPINSRLIYLGSCWTGRPGVRLPDEAIGFPTLLLQAGAAGVVAPMWPISDAAAATFSAAFYTAWAVEGTTTGRALAEAMRLTRARHPRSMTWAAFVLHGT